MSDEQDANWGEDWPSAVSFHIMLTIDNTHETYKAKLDLFEKMRTGLLRPIDSKYWVPPTTNRILLALFYAGYEEARRTGSLPRDKTFAEAFNPVDRTALREHIIMQYQEHCRFYNAHPEAARMVAEA